MSLQPINIEAEIKYKVKDLSPIISRFKELRAVKVRKSRQIDIYLDHPCRSFVERDEALRIRIDDAKAELTYKGPRKRCEAKIREEISIKVSNPSLLLMLLLRLGFKEVARIYKIREEYKLGNVRVFLDIVKDLGKFIEIEFNGEHEAKVKDLIKKLKLKKEDEIEDTYLELLLMKKGSQADPSKL